MQKAALAFILYFICLGFSINAAPQIPSSIAVTSPSGIKLFKESVDPSYYLPLSLQFITQDTLTHCSIASSVMILNALDIPAPIDTAHAPYKMFTQNNFFTDKVTAILPVELVKKQGATLDQIAQALTTFPVTVKTQHANNATLDQFRKQAKNTIKQKTGYIIVNFLRTYVGEQGFGHMSPLAAYDEKTDRFLILDVARYRYTSIWVKTEDLWHAMNTQDATTDSYRGWIIVSKPAQ